MFKYIDKPQLPEEIVTIIRQQVKEHQDNTVLSDFDKMRINESIQEEIDKAYGQATEGLGMPFETSNRYPGLAEFIMIKANDQILEWIKENVASNLNGLHIQVIDGSFVFPHIDMLRNRVWNYTIDTADAETSFYIAKPEYAHLELKARTYVPYERVNEIQRYKIDANRWHELDVGKIHGVDKINGVRLALSISFVD